MTLRDAYRMACPDCGNDDELHVVITTLATLTVDGTEPVGPHEWTDDSPCMCPRCFSRETVADFRIDDDADISQPPTKETA